MQGGAFNRQTYAHHCLERVELPCSLAEVALGLAGEPYVFLLDSAAAGPRLGQYSFLAVRPPFVVRLRRRGATGRVQVEWPGEPERSTAFETPDPFEVIRRALQASRGERFASAAKHGPGAELPFIGGLVGYIGYEMLHFVESVPAGPLKDVDLPDLLLAASDTVVALCHRTGEAFLSVIGRGRKASSARAGAAELLAEVRDIVTWAAHPVRANLGGDRSAGSAEVSWRASLSESDYLWAIGEIKERIAAGALYEMNLTRRLSGPFGGRAEELYRLLRRSNPAPFGAFYKTPEARVLSCSPERFLRMEDEGWIETRPIKGTRGRGISPEQDNRLSAELSASVKDRAEHIMIVDLLRNDLGRVCEFGTVRVPEVMTIERYATVLQMVSTVVGRLRSGLDVVDLLRATFPGGSMTGAPKIAAMQLISRLEPVARGIYSGCLGYLDVRGGCDLNMVIRTAIIHGGRVHLHAGGAIVADSQPVAEFEEACLKADALRQAVEALAPKRSAPITVA